MITFDRDGTLIGSLVDYRANDPRLIKRPEDQVIVNFIPGYLKKHAHLTMGVISNQNGVGRYKPLKSVVAEFVWLLDKLPELKFAIFSFDDGERAWLVTPQMSQEVDFPDLKGRYRKPDVGMFYAAVRIFGEWIDYYVGDLSGRADYANGLSTDLHAAIRFGIKYIDVRNLSL